MFSFIKNKNNGNIILIYHSSFGNKDKQRDTYLHNVTPDNIITQINFLKNYYKIISIDDLFSSEMDKITWLLLLMMGMKIYLQQSFLN